MVELNVHSCFAWNNLKFVVLTKHFKEVILPPNSYYFNNPSIPHAVVNGFSKAVYLLATQQANRIHSAPCEVLLTTYRVFMYKTATLSLPHGKRLQLLWGPCKTTQLAAC
jgi:hypothetical protein